MGEANAEAQAAGVVVAQFKGGVVVKYSCFSYNQSIDGKAKDAERFSNCL